MPPQASPAPLSSPFRRSPAGRAVSVGALIGAACGSAYLVRGIFRSTNSTAVIGFLFLPFFAAGGAVVGGLFAGSAATALRRERGPAVRTLGAAAALLILFCSTWVAHRRMVFERDLAAAPAMDEAAVDAYISNGDFRDDWRILYAFARSPNATPHILERLAGLGNASLTAEVLSNPLVPAAVLERLAHHENTQVSRAAKAGLERRRDAAAPKFPLSTGS